MSSILSNEEQRYVSKGYGLITAGLIAAAYFYLAPILIQTVWPLFMNFLQSGESTWVSMTILTLLWHYLWLIVSNLSLWVIYHIEHPFFERYKVMKEPWPWQNDKKEWVTFLKKTLKQIAINNLIVLPCCFLIAGLVNNFYIPYSISTETLPDHMTFAVNIIFQLLAEDLILHFVHKWLHHPRLYPFIHKRHHEYVQTIGIAAEYSHPIEFLLIGFLPNVIISFVIGKRMHITTMLMYNFAREFETHDGHSGYEFSWSPYRLIPFSTSAAYHDFHHSHNIGNYSSYLSFWDTIFGCNKVYYDY